MNESSWNNKSSVLKKVKQDGNNLRFASPNLRADRSIVFEAFRETEERFISQTHLYLRI